MFYSLILISGLNIVGIGADMNSTYHDVNVFNCTIKVSDKYELYVNSDLRIRYVLPPVFGTGSFSFLTRDGFAEKRIRGAKTIKNESNNGLDYILFEVPISMKPSIKFVIIRDADIEMFISGDDVRDMQSVYEGCVSEREKQYEIHGRNP